MGVYDNYVYIPRLKEYFPVYTTKPDLSSGLLGKTFSCYWLERCDGSGEWSYDRPPEKYLIENGLEITRNGYYVLSWEDVS